MDGRPRNDEDGSKPRANGMERDETRNRGRRGGGQLWLVPGIMRTPFKWAEADGGGDAFKSRNAGVGRGHMSPWPTTTRAIYSR